MVARCFLFMILLLVGSISFSANKLGMYFFSKPSASSIKKSWRDTYTLTRMRKTLTKEKLEKRSIFTLKPVIAYQSALFNEPDHKKVAYIIYYYDKVVHEGTICTLYSIKKMRQKGCGSYLLLKCMDHLRKKGAHKLVLQACPFEKITDEKELKKLIKFYTKFGFSVVHNQPIGVTMELVFN